MSEKSYTRKVETQETTVYTFTYAAVAKALSKAYGLHDIPEQTGRLIDWETTVGPAGSVLEIHLDGNEPI